MIPKAESRAYFRQLGKHIAVLRREQGMTQTALARALGVSQQTVFAYELGDRRVSVLMLVKLAGTFSTTVEQLSGLKMPVRPRRRVSPAELRHVETMRELTAGDKRVVRRVAEALRR